MADLKGFIQSSQLRTGTPFEGLIDQKIEVKVLEADPKKNKLILSQRQAVAEQRDQVVDNVLSSLEEDLIVKGNVVRITDFGAFVDIYGIDGLLPISEISCLMIISSNAKIAEISRRFSGLQRMII